MAAEARIALAQVQVAAAVPTRDYFVAVVGIALAQVRTVALQIRAVQTFPEAGQNLGV